jgi:hypothetical protein
MKPLVLEWYPGDKALRLRSGNWWASGVTAASARMRDRYTSAQRKRAVLMILCAVSPIPPAPFSIVMTRLMGKHERPWDEVNLLRAFKATQDGIAKALKIDDGDPDQAWWHFGQERSPDKRAGVRVTIETRGE